MSHEVAIHDQREPRDIGLASLGHAQDYATNVSEVTGRVVDHFRNTRLEEANQLLAQVLDAIHVLVFTIDSASHVLEGDLAERCPDASADSEAWIARLLEAQENRDWIRVADVLEYDVRRSLDGWSETLAAIVEGEAR